LTGAGKEGSGSFSEEKEPKRLLEALRGDCSRLGLLAPVGKSLFASFSSEKEESCLLLGWDERWWGAEGHPTRHFVTVAERFGRA
jgi:hypothetical protein